VSESGRLRQGAGRSRTGPTAAAGAHVDYPLAQARGEVFQGELPAATLIVVESLLHPDFLIEVEGVAAV